MLLVVSLDIPSSYQRCMRDLMRYIFTPSSVKAQLIMCWLPKHKLDILLV